MKVLIDTHVFIWWTGDPQKLSPSVYNLLVDANTEAILSIASIWEMRSQIVFG